MGIKSRNLYNLSKLNKNVHSHRLVRDPRANYKQSMGVLEHVKKYKPDMVTKTSIMVGLGETEDQIYKTMEGKKDGHLYVIQRN